MNHKILCSAANPNRKELISMQSLTKEYLFLFNTIVRTQQELQRLQQSLVEAQRIAEELYLERTDGPAA